MQQKFFELLEEENKKGATILFSSHILSEVQRLCNRVAIIKEGKIVTVEKISTLKENTYKKFKMETKIRAGFKLLQLNGVNKLEVKNNVTSFLFKGNIN